MGGAGCASGWIQIRQGRSQNKPEEIRSKHAVATRKGIKGAKIETEKKY